MKRCSVSLGEKLASLQDEPAVPKRVCRTHTSDSDLLSFTIWTIWTGTSEHGGYSALGDKWQTQIKMNKKELGTGPI